MTFGQKLATAREEAGLTQEELARKLYVTRQGLSRWENGKTQPSIETLGLICNILGKQPAYFIEVKEEIGRREYRELSRNERTVACEDFIRTRCRFFRLWFFLFIMAHNVGVGGTTFFSVQLINRFSSFAVSGVVGGVVLEVGSIIAMFLFSYRCSVMYNAYLLSELNVVRTKKLFIV